MASTLPLPSDTERAGWVSRLGITERRPALLGAAVASWVAAAIHAILIRDHWRYWVPAGVFFAACTVVQVVSTAVLIGRSRPRALVSVVVANVVVIAVYIVSRTSGIPGAPGIPAHGSVRTAGVPIIPGALERVGSQDLLALIAELVVVIGVAVSLSGRSRQWVMNGLMGFGATLILLNAIGILG